MGNQSFKCKTCGAMLDELAAKSTNGLVECPYCNNVWTVPRKETSPEALAFLRMGEHDLDTCKFDDALAAYKKAAELDPKEPEAYFGIALSSFNVQYLKDEVNDCLQPICHEISEKVFTEDKNYRRALELATVEQKKVYRRKGGEIDDIRDEFLAHQNSGLSYDCFLCVKVTEEDGRTKTEDYNRANEIYYDLKDKGYKPFYSEREMKGRTGSAYEALILYALYTSECMLIVCSNEDYLQTKWVKNEYTRFINLMQEGGKERDALTFVFAGKPIEKLPNGKKIQGIDLSKPDAYSRITEYVQSHTPAARAKREEDARRKAGQNEETARRFSALEEELQRFSRSQRGVQTTAASLLTRGYQELGDGHLQIAKGYFDRILDSDAKNAEAWWGEFLCEMNFWNDSQLNGNLTADQFKIIRKSINYKHAIQYASGDFGRDLEKIRDKLSRDEIDFVSRGYNALGNGDFETAQKFFDLVLETESENAEAWRGKFLSEFAVNTEDALFKVITLDNAESIITNESLINFLRFKKSDEYDGVYKKIIAKVEKVESVERNRWKREIAKKRFHIIFCIFVVTIAFALATGIGGGIVYGILYVVFMLLSSNLVLGILLEGFLNGPWHIGISVVLDAVVSIILIRKFVIHALFTHDRSISREAKKRISVCDGIIKKCRERFVFLLN